MYTARLIILATAVAFVSFLAVPSSPALGASYVVDTTADDGPVPALTACTGTANDCSLRGAITNANAASTPGDVITFDAAVGTIAIGTSLPAMTVGNDTIDGTATAEVIQGAEDRSFSCITISSASNTIKGLTVTDCQRAIGLTATASDNNTIGPGNTLFDNGIGIFTTSSATGNTIIGNKIGTNAAGTAIPTEGGNATGVFLFSGDNTIGGVTEADLNIISGNGGGIIISGAGATGNEVYGNFIGTDVTGTVDLGNSGSGVNLNGASSNTIGGVLEGQGNLISGNDVANVSLINASDSNTVAGNLIGPNINGAGNLASGDGITLGFGPSDNTVGPGNVISDNTEGLVLSSSGTSGNVVKGNLIGTNVAGTAALPNADAGIFIQSSAGPNTIGGTNPGDGNVIAFNTFYGILVDGTVAPAAVGNAIRANSIHDSGGPEIFLTAGGNFNLAPPTVSSAGSNAAGGTACANCWVDVFSDGASDAEFYEGSVQADGSGQWALYTAIVGPNVTATNTDSSGNTSQLSSSRPFDAESDADGVPDALDNCLLDNNSNQADADGDGAGDACDTDDDDDALLDGSDSCPVLAEDFDGFQDTDGCPDPDNDLDGVCDAGQANVSCAGSDSGKPCFDPAGTLSCPTTDCRNVAEDIDAFKDSDGCPEPDNDNDGFPDVTDACPGTDAHAGADGMLGSPEDLNHNGVRDDPPEAPFTTDDSVLVFEDYDGILDGDGCHDSPGDDFDGDGFTDEFEVLAIGTNPGRACPLTGAADGVDNDGDTVTDEPGEGANDEDPDPFPSDADDNQIVNIGDVIILFSGKILNPPAYTPRSDFDDNDAINIGDVIIGFSVKAQIFDECAPVPGP